ncbi:hypothetical protein SAMN05216345_1352 [Cupriavidus sp. YR651]|nr:hypothetical protein SAMN05216345_1352 [Cupriavidus sp. YR651]
MDAGYQPLKVVPAPALVDPIQMPAVLCALGFTGSYDRVAAFARRWRQEQQELVCSSDRGTYIPLRFAEGEAFQFDWSGDWAVIAGDRSKQLL